MTIIMKQVFRSSDWIEKERQVLTGSCHCEVCRSTESLGIYLRDLTYQCLDNVNDIPNDAFGVLCDTHDQHLRSSHASVRYLYDHCTPSQRQTLYESLPELGYDPCDRQTAH